MADFRVSHAQNREDIILSGFFKGQASGFYVDVGANHPDTLSITKYFYDQGWHGINIEPNPVLYKEIVGQRDRDINVNLGAADKSGQLVLREYPDGDGLSTFAADTQAAYQQPDSEYKPYTNRFEDHVVEVQTLAQIFAAQNVTDIQFMNIDVEGFEYQVIQGNDWEKYRPQVICIEANHIVKDWRPLLKKAHYSLLFFDGLNNYYVADECPEIASKFSYVNTMLLEKPVIPAVASDHLMHLQQQIHMLENKLVRQDLVQQNLRVELHNVYTLLAHNRRLRSLVKQLFQAVNTIILIRIEKLNKPKVIRQAPLVLDQSGGSKELLAVIRQYDMAQYYNASSRPPASYRIVYAGYRAVYNGLKVTARSCLRVIRRGR